MLEAHRVPLPEQRGVAEDDQAGAGPKLEMTQPQLLIDQPERFIDRRALLGRDLDVGEGEELEHLVLRPPHAAQFILRPAAGRRSDDLAVAGTLARPAASLEILLEHFDRRAVVPL